MLTNVTKRLYSKRFTVASHSPIHTPTAVPTMQGNNQHQEQLGLGGVLLRGTSTLSWNISIYIESTIYITRLRVW